MVNLKIKKMFAGYGEKFVLNNINMTVDEGDFLGIIGPNGCGKSTLIRAITGVVNTVRGDILLDGRPISGMSRKDVAKNIAVVPQNTFIGFPFTTWEVVLMGRNPYVNRFESLKSEDYERAHLAVNTTGIEGLKDRRVNTLSGGELQRVVIARAIAQDPKLLLLDEATSHLDIGHKVEMMDMIKDMNRKDEISVVSVHHNLDIAARYCDKLVLIDNGRIRTMGYPEEVLTPGHLRAVYGIEAEVHENPRDGTLYISPIDHKEIERTYKKRIHVICGGGSGRKLLKALVDNGYGVSAGVLNAMDTDLERAEFLDIDVVAEAPFSPIGDEKERENLKKIGEAETVILTDFPIGPGNLNNMEAGMKALETGKEVILMDRTDIGKRDYTGGEGEILYRKMLDNKAKIAGSVKEVLTLME